VTIDIDNLTGNEDPEVLAKLLDNATYELDGTVKLNQEPEEQEEAKPAEDKPADAQKPEEQKPAADAEEKGDKQAPPASDDKAPERDENGKFVATKDGKGKIPYEVLAAAREQAKQFRTQAEQHQAQLDDAQRIIETLKNQLTTANLKPADLPENTKIDPEKLKALRDDFPELAEMVQTMSDQVEFLKGRVVPPKQSQPAESNPVQEAVAQNAALSDWMKNDADRWDTALAIDTKLMNDPAWKDKPLTERFAEVERRTKAVFGDEVLAPKNDKADAAALQKQADEKLAQARKQSAVPDSPSDVGTANTTNPGNITEWAANASTADVYERMGSMSEAEIEKLLRSVI